MLRWYTIEQYFKRNGMRWLEKFFTKELLPAQQVHSAEIRRILVIRQHDMLGDFLLATPVLRRLSRRTSRCRAAQRSSSGDRTPSPGFFITCV